MSEKGSANPCPKPIDFTNLTPYQYIGREGELYWTLSPQGKITRIPNILQLPGAPATAESTPSTIGRITLDMKRTGKRSAGKPHAAFDEAGAGNVAMGEL